jgi:hypothetical protein
MIIPDAFSMLQHAWLWSLLILWALLLFGGFVLGPTRHNRRIPRWARLGSSAVLVLAGWSWAWFAAGSNALPYARFMALGITFGLLGDLFLADLLWRSRSQSVMAGMAAFAVGHLGYIAGIGWLARCGSWQAAGPRWGALVLLWLVGIAGWYGMVIRGQSKIRTLHRVALPYALLLATTAGLALGLALQAVSFWPLALGALLFLSSDLMLAGALFNEMSFPLIHDVVWLTYGPGQMLLVWSVAAALQLCR